MAGTVLILGATGRFGRNAAEAFWNAGWSVRNFDRKADDLNRAAADVDVIVHAWNPPYDQWQKAVPDLTRQVIEAARQNNATVIIPGNVYVFGADAPQNFGPQTPHAATNPLGRVRIEMEEAFRTSGVRTILLRGGDFLDTEASGNWFDKIMIDKLQKGKLVYPGDPDTSHAWAYLPDMTRAAVALANKREVLDPFEDVPFPGFTLSGRELARLVAEVSGQHIRLARMNWLPLRLMAPFWKMGQHLLEMRYLWSKPHHLDSSRFDELLPDFWMTPEVEAVRNAIAHKALAAKENGPNLSDWKAIAE